MAKRFISIALVMAIVAAMFAFPAFADAPIARMPSKCACGGRSFTTLADAGPIRTEYTRYGCDNTTATHQHYIDHYYHQYQCKSCMKVLKEQYKTRELCQVGNFRMIVR